MEVVRRLSVMLAAAALLLGASGMESGAAVLCIGAGGGHVALEAAGAGHCGDEAPGTDGAVTAPGDCLDVRIAPVDLERPGSNGTPSFVKVPDSILPAPTAVSAVARMETRGPARAPPPPHLVALPTFILRI